MYFVRNISSMRYVPSGREKEFISYRNETKRSYIAFGKNISREQSEYIAKFFVSNLIKSNAEAEYTSHAVR